jgi:glutamate-1-semialdehyde aminotransferase
MKMFESATTRFTQRTCCSARDSCTGIYPPPSQFEAWFFSGAHTAKDIDTTISAARGAMREIATLKVQC